MPGKKELSFQNATYYINQQEWDFAFEKGFPSYITEDFLALKKVNNCNLQKVTEQLMNIYIMK